MTQIMGKSGDAALTREIVPEKSDLFDFGERIDNVSPRKFQ
jgi:hypothetical protein